MQENFRTPSLDEGHTFPIESSVEIQANTQGASTHEQKLSGRRGRVISHHNIGGDPPFSRWYWVQLDQDHEAAYLGTEMAQQYLNVPDEPRKRYGSVFEEHLVLCESNDDNVVVA